MLRSMYSGISGLKVNQTKLDVIGNNIANVGTTSFKAQRIRFQDMMSQNLGAATGASLRQGGTNPKQIGLGVQISGIDTISTQGNMQPTGRNLDVAVDGEGYFMVAKGPGIYGEDGVEIDENHKVTDSKGLDISYTRDGAFTLDSYGNLLTSDGYRVLGYGFGALQPNDEGDEGTVASGKLEYLDPDKLGEAAGDNNTLSTLVIPESVIDTEGDGKPLRVIGFSIEPTGLIKATLQGGKVSAVGQLAMSSFKNPGGLEKIGKNMYQRSSNSGDPIVKCPVTTPKDDAANNSEGYGSVIQGALEMSNVDLAEQFTEMIVASRAFQANGKMISTGDEILQDLVNLKR